jgi:purine-binding chemotaxis protein CheW
VSESNGKCLYCTFRLAGRLFGVDVGLVKEVSTRTGLTPVPLASASVLGLVNLRGQLHLVLDLQRLLGLGTSAVTAASRLVVFKPVVGEAFGLLADAAGDVVRLGPGQTERYMPDDPARAGGLVTGIGKTDNELIILVDPHRLLAAVGREGSA